MTEPDNETLWWSGVPPKDDLILELDQAHAVISRLRAVLAPLLDEPWRDQGTSCDACVFCGYEAPVIHFRDAGKRPHEPGCPVLRKDELLGRVHA